MILAERLPAAPTQRMEIGSRPMARRPSTPVAVTQSGWPLADSFPGDLIQIVLSSADDGKSRAFSTRRCLDLCPMVFSSDLREAD